MFTLRHQDGFTLVELMMATAITLIVIATATGTFKNALLLNDTATLVADSNQNLRSVSNVFVRDFMQAGRGIPTGGIPIPSGAGATPLIRPAPPSNPQVVLHFENVTQSTLSAVITGYQLGSVVNGRPTDIVTMLALDPTSYVAFPAGSFKPLPLNIPTNIPPNLPLPAGITLPVPTLAADGASLDVGQFSTWLSDPVSGIKVGDILLFTNNTVGAAAIQTVTRVSGTTVFFAPGDFFNFNQRGAQFGSIMALLTAQPVAPAAPVPPAFPQTDVVRIQMLTYYLDAVTTLGEPRLMRQLNFPAPLLNISPPQPLADMVDDLTITYDLKDPDSPLAPVNQPTLPYTTPAGKLFGASDIRKANLRIAVRSAAKSTLQNDYLRNTTTTVVSLRNLAYYDRYK
jgi:prepilin-type N-terminal cleavage/methylation domain-containing protein